MAIFFLLPGTALGLPTASLEANPKLRLDCGSVSTLCGIMTLETGKGTGTHRWPAATTNTNTHAARLGAQVTITTRSRWSTVSGPRFAQHSAPPSAFRPR
eukprot:scaffold131865_cov87-Phaeocystis_antarctica.AAC.5